MSQQIAAAAGLLYRCNLLQIVRCCTCLLQVALLYLFIKGE